MSPRHNALSSVMRSAWLLRVGFGAVAAASFAGLMSVSAEGSANAADQSSITVKWLGDASSAAQYQPTRAQSGFEYNEFKNVSVTVGQSQNLIDQAVQIDVSGFMGGTLDQTDGGGTNWSTAMNFVQAMQCWGDPSSVDFRNSCEWGGKNAPNNGLGKSVFNDNVYRIASGDVGPSTDTTTDVPFDTVTGTSITARYVTDTTGSLSYPLLSYFGPSTTNEVSGARVKDDGTAEFDFQMQSANSAPQLGCGSAGHLRCWLVLVPRGTVFGGNGYACGGATQSDLTPFSFGQSPSIQAGSPLSKTCGYWDNRIVVPLDFNPVGGPCPSGAEQRITGSQLAIVATASWQPKLCTTAGATYSFVSNPDSVAREQLLDQQTKLIFSSYPVVRADLSDESLQQKYDTTTLSYAPVAVGGLALSYFAENGNGRLTTLRLTPRLIAKLLTQSYPFEVPQTSSESDDTTHLGTVNRTYTHWNDDPDFRVANPDWSSYQGTPALVLPGPSGADAIAQLWKWIQSDQEAKDFLDGKPDKWGMTVNPYYLPAGNAAAVVPQYDSNDQLVVDSSGKAILKAVGRTNVDGSPMSISSASLDYFPLADDSAVPHRLINGQRIRLGSLDFLPYVNDFAGAAFTTFRANPGARTTWDPSAIDPAGDVGAWTSSGPQIIGQRFVIAITDVASAGQYDLSNAQLRAANGTTYVAPTTATMTKALSSGLVSAAGSTSVQQVDPTRVSADGYPLTTLVYAITNLNATTSGDRTSYAAMLKYVSTDGQVVGTQQGELPLGYAPLPSAQVAQANAAASAIASWIPPATEGSSSGALDDGGYVLGSGSNSYGSTSGIPVSQATATPTSEPLAAEPASGSTPVPPENPVSNAALAVSLGVGAAGSIFSPILLRRRRQ